MSDIKLLTPEETAQILGLSPKTIKDWCRAGYIKAVKIGKGGIWRIPENELDRLIKERSGKREVRKIAIALSKGGVGKTTQRSIWLPGWQSLETKFWSLIPIPRGRLLHF